VPWKPPDDWSYSYLLGSYLGDGYLSKAGQLLIVCDRRYPEIIEEVRGAMILTSLRQHVGNSPHPEHEYVAGPREAAVASGSVQRLEHSLPGIVTADGHERVGHASAQHELARVGLEDEQALHPDRG
jgi:hypothetical protein